MLDSAQILFIEKPTRDANILDLMPSVNEDDVIKDVVEVKYSKIDLQITFEVGFNTAFIVSRHDSHEEIRGFRLANFNLIALERIS